MKGGQTVDGCLPHVDTSPTEREDLNLNQSPCKNGQCGELEWTESEATLKYGTS